MSKSTRQLVIVGNAFERERRAAQAAPKRVMWTRDELADLLNVYGRMVAAGMWRDYAINDGREAAGFSIFRRSSEVPLFRIDKIPALKRKQGQYVLHAMACKTYWPCLRLSAGILSMRKSGTSLERRKIENPAASRPSLIA